MNESVLSETPSSPATPWGRRGAFTTIRVEGSPPRLLFLDEHLGRLFHSANLLGLSPSLSCERIQEEVMTLVTSVPLPSPFLLRVCLFESEYSMDCRPALPAQTGLSGRILRHARSHPEAKTTEDAIPYSMLAEMDLSKEDLLLVHPETECLLESATANLIFAKDDLLVIPEGNVLPGLTLDAVLASLYGTPRFRIERCSPRMDESDAFDEILACGSGREVSAFDAIPELDWRNRSVTAFDALSRAYATYKNERHA